MIERTIKTQNGRVIVKGGRHGIQLTLVGEITNVSDVASSTMLREDVRELRDALTLILGEDPAPKPSILTTGRRDT